MTVREIVEKYLRENGFDGLFDENDCACDIGGLFPCDEYFGECEPGYKTRCDCGDHDYHISPEKEVR